MSLKIISNCKKDELLKYVITEEGHGVRDVEEGDIESRVTRAKAEDEYLPAWKTILADY